MDISENKTNMDSNQVSHVGVAWEGALMYCNHKREEEGWLSLSGYCRRQQIQQLTPLTGAPLDQLAQFCIAKELRKNPDL